MNKQEAYKLARYAAEFFESDDELIEFANSDFVDFICWLYNNQYQIVEKKDESTVEITTG